MATRIIWNVSDGNGGTDTKKVVCTTKQQQRSVERQAREEAGSFTKEIVSNGHATDHHARTNATRRKSNGRPACV